MQDAALDQSPDPLQAALEKRPDKSEPKRGKLEGLKERSSPDLSPGRPLRQRF